jgi:hypothetical protein
MLKILGYIVANLTALILSSVSLVSTASIQGEAISLQLLFKLVVYMFILGVGFVFYRLGKRLFSSI